MKIWVTACSNKEQILYKWERGDGGMSNDMHKTGQRRELKSGVDEYW